MTLILSSLLPLDARCYFDRRQMGLAGVFLLIQRLALWVAAQSGDPGPRLAAGVLLCIESLAGVLQPIAVDVLSNTDLSDAQLWVFYRCCQALRGAALVTILTQLRPNQDPDAVALLALALLALLVGAVAQTRRRPPASKPTATKKS